MAKTDDLLNEIGESVVLVDVPCPFFGEWLDAAGLLDAAKLLSLHD